jgi:putative acyl-CoA dehydrogenase
MPAPFATHEVFNQPPPLEDVNLFSSDTALMEAVEREGGGDASERLQAFGRLTGSAEALGRGRLANEHPPRLSTHDARGHRSDTVTYHPAYHELMRASCGEGLHSSVWADLADAGKAPRPGTHVRRAGAFYMAAQMEAGHCCPITMTNAAVPVLLLESTLAKEWVPRILPFKYDPSFAPAAKKSAVTLGMGMTEKQGGTDVRANLTRAEPSADGYCLTGHKWFMSAPMCDAFLVLAQAPGGLTCFLLPRFAPDGSVNGLRLQRLKDKLGNRSNASAEVEFAHAFGFRVGEEGRGVRTIIEMVQLTRLDCAIASAGIMRMALAQAIHHARHRSVFQKHLADQPMMHSVLADMALEVEGVVALVMRLARAFDLAADDPRKAARARLLTPAVKYWVCKTAPGFIDEAMECLGGNGYVEDSVLPRLYREAPVNAIWEGSGNVMCLDVLRALAHEGETAHAVLRALAEEAGDLPGARAAADGVASAFAAENAEARARAAVERLALLAAAAALRQGPAPEVADLFARTRLAERHGAMYGTSGLAPGDADGVLARALPPA